jgi:hypothetical protein
MRRLFALLFVICAARWSFGADAGNLYGDLNPTGDELRLPTPLVVVEECGGALLGGAVGAFAAALAGGYVGSSINTSRASDINWTPLIYAGYTGALVGLPLGAATGSYVVGALERQAAAWRVSGLGAYAGTAVGLGFAYLAHRSDEANLPYVSVPLYVLAAAAPVSGAVLGYNVSTPCLASRCYEERFVGRGSEFEPAVQSSETVSPTVRVQLLTLRI